MNDITLLCYIPVRNRWMKSEKQNSPLVLIFPWRSCMWIPMDRDENAAINICREGIRISGMMPDIEKKISWFCNQNSNNIILNRGTHGDSSLMLCPIGQSNEKPPLQALAKWWEYVTKPGIIQRRTVRKNTNKSIGPCWSRTLFTSKSLNLLKSGFASRRTISAIKMNRTIPVGQYHGSGLPEYGSCAAVAEFLRVLQTGKYSRSPYYANCFHLYPANPEKGP